MSAPAPVMQPCPGCGMPRFADAIGRSPCPVCADMAPSAPEAPAPREAPAADPYAHLPADASVLYAAASPPPDKAARTPWRLLGLAFAAGALLGGLTVAAFRPASSPEPPADAFVSPIVALAERSPPASPVVSDPPAGKTADSAEKTPSAPPASPEAPVGKPGEEPGGQAAAKPPAPGQPEKPDPPGADKPGADRPGADRPVANQPEPEKPRPLPPPPLQRERIVVRLEQPEATYTVPEEWLQPGRSIVLRGQVRELPNRVTLLVEERRPFTLVSAGRLHWVDEDGRWLGVEDRAVTPPVPVISGLPEDELAGLRSEPGPRARAALALIRTLLRAGSLAEAVSEIDMSGREGPVLYTVDGIEVRLGAEDWEERLARLEGVLAQLAQDGAEVKSIDLRFRDQVVLTKGGRG
ncbi:MAG: cell division protein FtsQ/DivIB [Candidatus Rokubacteria bacterium]|nr:cell division protein FtsQ/DivIB [Candidatus Rokubacteria bacterium]